MKSMTRAVATVSVLLCTGPAFAQVRVAQAQPPAPPPAATPAPPAADVYAAPAAPPPPTTPPPPVPPPPPSLADWTFAFHGIAGTSLYIQDNPTFVLNGQGPLLLLGPRPANGGPVAGADIRQSRFNLSVAGPKVFGGAIPKAVLEIDLFGLDSPGGYGEVSAYERVRLAYAELKWENDLIRFGQDHELILGLVPEGMGHLAYPVNYFAGSLGWREPGIGYFHTIPMDASKLELAVQIVISDWENPVDFGFPGAAAAGTSNLNDLDVDLGQLSGLFGAEARVKYTSEHVNAFVAGHWNHVDATKNADLVSPLPGVTSRDFDVIAGVLGVKITGGGFSFLGSAYVGQNLGPLLGEQLQFITSNNVFEVGGWAQLRYAISPHLNVSVVAGTAQPKGSDIQTAALLSQGAAVAGVVPSNPLRATNTVFGGMIRYQDGGFAIGPEFAHAIATTEDQYGTKVTIDGNQGMLSGMYFF
jgi:hypothetical protein